MQFWFNDKASTKLRGVIKVQPLHPSPTMCVPIKSGCFAIWRNEISSFFRPLVVLTTFDLVKKSNHVSRGVLSFTKALGMSSYCEAFNWRGMEKCSDACKT